MSRALEGVALLDRVGAFRHVVLGRSCADRAVHGVHDVRGARDADGGHGVHGVHDVHDALDALDVLGALDALGVPGALAHRHEALYYRMDQRPSPRHLAKDTLWSFLPHRHLALRSS